jgi:hypothetical protein
LICLTGEAGRLFTFFIGVLVLTGEAGRLLTFRTGVLAITGFGMVFVSCFTNFPSGLVSWLAGLASGLGRCEIGTRTVFGGAVTGFFGSTGLIVDFDLRVGFIPVSIFDLIFPVSILLRIPVAVDGRESNLPVSVLGLPVSILERPVSILLLTAVTFGRELLVTSRALCGRLEKVGFGLVDNAEARRGTVDFFVTGILDFDAVGLM